MKHDVEKQGFANHQLLKVFWKMFPIPECFPANSMHLELNIRQLQVSLWHGTMEHSKDNDPSIWPFVVLNNSQTWKAYSAAVAAIHQYIPTCVESWTAQNPAEKISSGYKAIEYLLYVFDLCPALLYGLLEILVFGIQIIHQHHKSQKELVAAYRALLEYVYQFELLYYKRQISWLHFVRPCIHELVHLGEEIQLYSDPYTNLS